MKKTILVVLLIGLIFLMGNFLHTAVATNYVLGDMDLKIMLLTSSPSYNTDLLVCGRYDNNYKTGYNHNAIEPYNFCGVPQIYTGFASLIYASGGHWYCQASAICLRNSYAYPEKLANNLKIVSNISIGSTPSWPSCGSGWVELTKAVTGIKTTVYYTAVTDTVMCVRQEYYQYFKDEIYLSSAYGGYGVDPGCPAGTTSITKISTATYGPPPTGQMVVTKICGRNNGAQATINLDYNEAKCKTIYGNIAWGPDYSGWGGSPDRRCCGDDNDIDTEVLGASSYICKKNPSTGSFYWGKIPFSIVNVGISNGPYYRNQTYSMSEIVANNDVPGTVYAGASLITNLNSISCPKAGCIWDEGYGCYCNLQYQTFSLGSNIQETKTINFKIHSGFPDGIKGIVVRLWKTKTDTCNLMPNSPYYENGCLGNPVEGSIASYSNSSFITVTPENCTTYSNWITKTTGNGDIVKTRDSDNDGIYDQYCSAEGGVEPIILS